MSDLVDVGRIIFCSLTEIEERQCIYADYSTAERCDEPSFSINSAVITVLCITQLFTDLASKGWPMFV